MLSAFVALALCPSVAEARAWCCDCHAYVPGKLADHEWQCRNRPERKKHSQRRPWGGDGYIRRRMASCEGRPIEKLQQDVQHSKRRTRRRLASSEGRPIAKLQQ